jgi:hypothetical protein
MPSEAEAFSSSPTLALVQDAAQRGDRRLAHEICVQLLTDDPNNEQAWLWCAGTADSLDETIAALSQALTRNPANDIARKRLYEAMERQLRQDAFLAYVGETRDFYYVRTATNLRFAHPKDRAQPEPVAPPKLPARTAFRWLGWALVGLPPAGLGTLLCAPMAALAAIRLLAGHPSPVDRRRGWVVLGSASILWLFALVFIGLLILHLL